MCESTLTCKKKSTAVVRHPLFLLAGRVCCARAKPTWVCANRFFFYFFFANLKHRKNLRPATSNLDVGQLERLENPKPVCTNTTFFFLSLAQKKKEKMICSFDFSGFTWLQGLAPGSLQVFSLSLGLPQRGVFSLFLFLLSRRTPVCTNKFSFLSLRRPSRFTCCNRATLYKPCLYKQGFLDAVRLVATLYVCGAPSTNLSVQTGFSECGAVGV